MPSQRRGIQGHQDVLRAAPRKVRSADAPEGDVGAPESQPDGGGLGTNEGGRRGGGNAALEEFLTRHPVRKAEGGCWVWLKSVSCGVPKVAVDRKIQSAHRVIFELARRKLTAGEVVYRTCNDERCVAPEHLVAMTRKRVWKLRAKAGLVPSGKVLSARTTRSARSRSKLTIEIVRAIRARYAEIGNAKAVSVEFGLAHDHCHKIVKHKMWREASPWTV